MCLVQQPLPRQRIGENVAVNVLDRYGDVDFQSSAITIPEAD